MKRFSSKRLAVFGGLALFLLPGMAGVSRADSLHASIQVDATQDLGPVNPRVFGQSLEVGDTAGIFQATTRREKIFYGDGFWNADAQKPAEAVMEKAREVGVKVLRYPGGCLAHNFDWRKTVGPRAERGDWQFGLDEYLQVCRELGAEPLITVSDYVLPLDEMPAYAAGLVEYLNAPATADHPWALKRKEWGHPEPYGVRWFELGNESDHGNHFMVPRRQFSPQAYVDYANRLSSAMRMVDPSIQIGIIAETSTNRKDPDNTWNRTVFRGAGKSADFIVVHYYPGAPGPIGPQTENQAMIAMMAVDDQVEDCLRTFRKVILEQCGRPLPMAVTEYNNSMEGNAPAYRMTFGGALLAADAIRLWLKPENGVMMANYWQLFNGYFGSVRIDMKDPAHFKTQELAAYWMFRLWAQHFGQELLGTQVDSPKAEFAGMGRVFPARGKSYVPPTVLDQVAVEPRFPVEELNRPGLKATTTADGTLRIELHEFSGKSLYPVIATVNRRPDVGPAGCDYRLRFEGRFVPENPGASAAVGLGLADSRGWEATHMAISIPVLSGEKWTEFSDDFYALPDSPGTQVVVRLEPGERSISGVLEIRKLQMDLTSKAVYPAYDVVAASASVSADRRKVFLMVFNKSAQDAVATDVALKGFDATGGKRWEVTAPSLLSLGGAAETLSGTPVPVVGGRSSLELPPHSMTALEFDLP